MRNHEKNQQRLGGTMKYLLAGALAFAAGQAMAGGVERSAQSVAILFEQGNYGELTFGYVDPDVRGSVGGGAVRSGDMLEGYATIGLAYKQALRDNLDLAVIFDQPIGANVDYTLGTSYPLQGTTAHLESYAVTGLLRYKMPNNVSLIGGLRAQSARGEVRIPLVAGYALNTDTDFALGYVLGVAWERPDIAARVALTYNSAITHTLQSTEITAGPSGTGEFETEVPQSVNLEFQTGVAANTLLFGSIRWVDWTEFLINPPVYDAIQPLPLVAYSNDRITYTLGVGRRFNDTWSGAITLAHEPSEGEVTGNLGPTDGFTSIGLGATYTQGNMKITAGVRYIDVGDATTNPPISGNFANNDGWAAGVRIGYSF
jgi:long-subunit fatty acid transport protein